ncbi:diguanylate cyclase [Spirillospora albida]|uniref:diguanylate cyclase n=1 Tax=Spirillospora albida TaxID=58123 RepID=UPI0004C2121D|nr:diguanylate cyclase [Spirillospora albida]
MMWPWVAVYGVSAGVNLLLAVGAWGRRRVAPAFAATAVMLLMCSWYVLINLLVIVWDDRPGRVAVLTGLLVSDVAVVSAFLCLALLLIDRAWRPSRRLLLLLAVEPVVSGALLVTNGWHHTYYAVMPHPGQPFGEPGPALTLHTIYLYTIVGTALVRLGRAWLQNPRDQRRIYSWILISSLCPVIAGLVSLVFGLSYELAPIGMAITAVINYRALIEEGLPAQVSIARQRVMETIQDAVVVLDRAGLVLDANPAAHRLLRRLRPGASAEVQGRSAAELFGVHVDLAEGAIRSLTLTDARGVALDLDLSIDTLPDRRGAALGWALVARDTTELNDRRRQAEEANEKLQQQLATIEALRADLAEQAVRDSLTGLYNRRRLMEILAELYDQDRPFSLTLLDIDHFKRVNDTYGHNAGDAVLKLVARHLTGRVRLEDTVVRHGGEEFVVVMVGATPQDARARMEQVREHIAEVSRVEEPYIPVTFSAGVASAAVHPGANDLLHAADEALYAAKRLGRNRIELADPASEAAA